ncbi:MAG: thiamine diphosphokinase [Atopobiaceae bacterium]|nr:thiamine diphosphokinase [Atopobiaceae bacterium]
MPVRGAIFDCDGTLLDSMPMWTQVCVALLRNYGVEDAERIFAEHESLDMDKKCYWYHDNLGIGSSGEALYRELWTMVERAYAERVAPFEGCAAFLQELRSAGVRMVIASSTPTEMLRFALGAHGLLGYFDELVFAGDVGRGKEYPDVYLAAQERLGTPRGETWVFEDAPFGVRSAARVGFPVVAVLNDHDGRDEAFLQTWATVVARGYEGLSLSSLQALRPRTLDVLVVGGSPESSAAELVRALAQQAEFVIAADAGANVLAAAGVIPDLFCGDEDSVSDSVRGWAEGHAGDVKRYPVEKDDSDLGLALSCARAEAERRGACLRVVATCVSGGRPDHALGVWGVLARHADAAPRVVEDGFECRILCREGTPVWCRPAGVGQTVSAIALVGDAVVSERGFRWTLDHDRLPPLSDLGLSNKVVSDECAVECHRGTLAVFRV